MRLPVLVPDRQSAWRRLHHTRWLPEGAASRTNCTRRSPGNEREKEGQGEASKQGLVSEEEEGVNSWSRAYIMVWARGSAHGAGGFVKIYTIRLHLYSVRVCSEARGLVEQGGYGD